MFHKISEKYNALPVPVRASFFFIFTGALKDAVDVLTTPIFTRMLTLEEYGLFNVYNSWFQIIRIIITLYLFGDGFSVGMSRFSDDKEGFTSSQQGLVTVLFLFWSALALVFRKQVAALLGLGSGLIALMFCQSFFQTPLNCWQQKERYDYRYQRLTPVIVAYFILQPLVGIVLICLNSHGYNNGLIRIYSGVGVQIAFGVTVYILQFIRRPVFFDKKYWAFSIKTNSALAPHYMSQVLLNQSDRLMINAFVGAAQTSIYSVAHAAAFTLSVIVNNVNATFVPWLYESLKMKKTGGVRRISSLLVVFSAFVAMMLVLIAPEAMLILGGGKYAEGKWLIPPLSFSVYLIFVYSMFSDVEMFYGKNIYVLISSIVGATSNILLNYLMIPRLGYFVAGYTTVAGYLLMCLGHYFFLELTCRKEEIHVSELFHMPLICGVSLVLAALSGLIMLLYRTVILRYCIFLVFATGLIWKRKSLLAFYHRLKNDHV